MLRDATHQQVIQKFSFIESLSLPGKTKPTPQSEPDKLSPDEAFSFQHRNASPVEDLAVQAEATEQEHQASAIVATSDTAASSSISADWYQIPSTYELNLAEVINAAAIDSTEPNLSTKGSYLGKVLFALASGYCLFVLWWLFGHQGNRVLTTLTGGKQVVLSKSDVQFIDYMERSLNNIDRRIEAKQEASGKDEVVYVPVYTPPPTPQVSTTPSSTTNPVVPQSQPAPPRVDIPAPPPLPEPLPVEKDLGQKQLAAEVKPTTSHTLIGILELGEGKSAALVKVDGQTRRVWLGEAINTDGWILESVGNQQANISYQGQVRSIAVGETF